MLFNVMCVIRHRLQYYSGRREYVWCAMVLWSWLWDCRIAEFIASVRPRYGLHHMKDLLKYVSVMGVTFQAVFISPFCQLEWHETNTNDTFFLGQICMCIWKLYFQRYAALTAFTHGGHYWLTSRSQVMFFLPLPLCSLLHLGFPWLCW